MNGSWGGTFSKHWARIGTMNRDENTGGFQSRRDCDPKPGVARNELPWVGSGISTNPNGVVPTRRNPVGVVNFREPAPGVGPQRGPTPGSGTESRWDSREVQRYSSWRGWIQVGLVHGWGILQDAGVEPEAVQRALQAIRTESDPTVRNLEVAGLCSAVFRDRGMELVVIGLRLDRGVSDRRVAGLRRDNRFGVVDR
jgi:hypothetical protein